MFSLSVLGLLGAIFGGYGEDSGQMAVVCLLLGIISWFGPKIFGGGEF